MLPPSLYEHFDDLGNVREGVVVTVDFDGESIDIVKIRENYVGVRFGGRGATLNLPTAEIAGAITAGFTVHKA